MPAWISNLAVKRGAILQGWLLGLILTIQCWNAAAEPITATSLEQLTMVYLYNFLKFTEWPNGETMSELTLCVTDTAKFGAVLDDLAGRTAQNKKVQIKRIGAVDNPSVCQLLFLYHEEPSQRIRDLLRKTENQPILMVSDLTEFLNSGGMIILVEQDNRLQFEVNLDKVKSAGLKLNSQLLKLAREIKENNSVKLK